jgi:hypothetical protein
MSSTFLEVKIDQFDTHLWIHFQDSDRQAVKDMMKIEFGNPTNDICEGKMSYWINEQRFARYNWISLINNLIVDAGYNLVAASVPENLSRFFGNVKAENPDEIKLSFEQGEGVRVPYVTIPRSIKMNLNATSDMWIELVGEWSSTDVKAMKEHFNKHVFVTNNHYPQRFGFSVNDEDQVQLSISLSELFCEFGFTPLLATTCGWNMDFPVPTVESKPFPVDGDFFEQLSVVLYEVIFSKNHSA